MNRITQNNQKIILIKDDIEIMLPYVSGDRILAEIRAFSDVPVIVVSAKGLTQTKIETFSVSLEFPLEYP